MNGSRLLSQLARHGGTRLVNAAIDRILPPSPPRPEPAVDQPKKKGSLTGKLLGAAALRIATKSVPGAILIGGGMLAKSRYDRRRAKKVDSAAGNQPDT